MLNEIILQVFFAALGVSLVNSEKFKFLHKIRYAIYVLILSYLVYKGVPWDRENYYIYLNITPNATKQEIQTAYRQAAKIYHPDKNPNVADDSSFIKLKLAYDILTNDVRRSYYNRFGDYKNGEVDDNAATLLICLSLVQQIMFFIIGYFLSYPKKLKFSRQIFLVYNIASFCFELQFRFIEDDTTFDWLPFFGYLLPFEKILLLRTLFPIVFFLSICISNYIYTDKNATIVFLMRSILATNRVIVERTNDVVESTNYLKNNGAQLLAKLQQARKTGDTPMINGKASEEDDNKELPNENAKELTDAKGKPLSKEKLAEAKLVDNIQKFSLTLDTQQMQLLESCFNLLKNKDPNDQSKKKKAWYETISLQMIFAIIFLYVWFTSK